jgi:hypothetical protein
MYGAVTVKDHPAAVFLQPIPLDAMTTQFRGQTQLLVRNRKNNGS